MTTIAFHGNYANARILRRDMGDPPWVDHYHNGLRLRKALHEIDPLQPVILVGYSRGGDLIAQLTHYLDNIVAVVLYECPLTRVSTLRGSFPVLSLWNNYHRSQRRQLEMEKAIAAWRLNHEVEVIFNLSMHSHFHWVAGWPPLAHSWDQSLNRYIGEWINDQRRTNRLVEADDRAVQLDHEAG